MTGEFPVKEAYVIVDTEEGKADNLYSLDSERMPWILHSFTDELCSARFFASRDLAQKLCDMFTRTRLGFDGSTTRAPGRLRVMKVTLVPVEQGG